MRATDVMLAGKTVVVCGFGDVGKGSAPGDEGGGRVAYRDRDRPDLRAAGGMEGFQVATMEDCVSEADIFITTTGNKDIITVRAHEQMKNNAIVGNIGHFDNEIEMAGLETRAPSARTSSPSATSYDFPDGHGIIILAEGRLLNLGLRHRSPVVRHVATRSPTRRSRSSSSGTSARTRQVRERRCTSSPRSSTRRSPRFTSRSWASSSRSSARSRRLHRRPGRGSVQARDLPLLSARVRSNSVCVSRINVR